jgi:hypothetical protein
MIIYYRNEAGLTMRMNPEDMPVAIVLSDEDKKNITHIAPGNDTYCVYPDTLSWKDIKEWLAMVKELEKGQGKPSSP